MALQLVPTPPPGRENQPVNPREGPKGLQKGPEMSEEQRVAAKMAERPFRDGVIEREEAQWNTPEKEQRTVETEVARMRDTLEKLDEDRMRQAVESRKKRGETELKPPEDFVLVFEECGVEEEHLAVLKKACPVGREEGTPPYLKHFADACIVQINKFLKSEQNFSKAAFIDAVVVDYVDRRKKNFLKDQTAEIIYKDRNNVPNFYNGKEGIALMRREARKELGLDQPAGSASMAA